MKSDKLLEVIGEAKESYVLSALDSRNGKKKPQKRRSFNRTLLIAAVIAMMLLLVGCVVVFLGLQERIIGKSSYTKYADEQGEPIEPTEMIKNVISLYGYKGSPSYMAAHEWYTFLENYNPSDAAYSDENSLGIPENYYISYQCVTWDMVDKVNEISEKYGLKPMGTFATAQNYDTEIFFDAIGIKGLCHNDANANVKYGSGYFYPEGAFNMSVGIALTGDDAHWTDWVYSSVMYTRKDVFDPKFTTIEPDKYEEWTYTTADGTEVLIAMSKNDALLFVEQEDAYITVTMTTNITAWDLQPSEYSTSRESLQQLADVYDFTIRPQPIADMDSIRIALEESTAAWEAERMALIDSPQHSSYAENLTSRYDRIRMDLYYTFLDINSDGVDDLIIGSSDGRINEVLTISGGIVTEIDYNLCGYLFEENVLLQLDIWDHTKTFRFYRLNNSVVEFLFCLDYDQRTDTWRKNDNDLDRDLATSISAKDAQKILDAYTPVKLEMRPLMDFPVDSNGTTLQQTITKEVVSIPEEEILRIYANYIKEYNATGYDRSCKYYCLKDVNNDGIVDLIFSDNTDEFHHIVTVYNGELRMIVSSNHLFLCENGILLSNFKQITGNGIKTVSHNWYKFDCTMPDGGRILIDSTKYDPKGPIWYWDEDADGYYEHIISEDEYNQIIVHYPRITLEMKPISEFPMP